MFITLTWCSTKNDQWSWNFVTFKVNVDYEQEVQDATNFLIGEWAGNLFNTKFSCMKDLTLYLIDKIYVDNRSAAAHTILSSLSKAGGMYWFFSFIARYIETGNDRLYCTSFYLPCLVISYLSMFNLFYCILPVSIYLPFNSDMTDDYRVMISYLFLCTLHLRSMVH